MSSITHAIGVEAMLGYDRAESPKVTFPLFRRKKPNRRHSLAKIWQAGEFCGTIFRLRRDPARLSMARPHRDSQRY